MNDPEPQTIGVEDIHQNAALYCELMEFIKWRVEAVLKTLALVKAGKYYLHKRVAAEFCILQLRMCCELLALGCVVIHADVPQRTSLQDQWNADKIMKKFSAFKPTFFPRGIRDKKAPDGIFEHVQNDGAFTQAELLSYYNSFGGWLHTGTLDNYVRPTEKVYDFSKFEEFVHKLSKLLSAHTYLLNGDRTMVRVIMHDIENGRVGFNVLELVPDPQKSPG